MIIKSFEADKLKSLNLGIHLIYGNNEGIKQDIISNFYKKNYKGEVLKYDEQDILTNKDEFISSLLNKSLLIKQDDKHYQDLVYHLERFVSTLQKVFLNQNS